MTKPASTASPLSACVCTGKVSTSIREKIITAFELLHKRRVWFGLCDYVPCLTDPKFKIGGYIDITESVLLS